jgi:protein-S-isoprenylcysteine O-methyltransferase Ste14
MSRVDILKAIWLFGVVAWYVIRFPHERRSRRTPVAQRAGGWRDKILMSASLTGLGVIPVIYLLSGAPRFADYTPHLLQSAIGVLLLAGALVLFHLTHKQLGRNWSVTLNTRKSHKLIDTGLYAYVRHPMYSAFWLLALAQAFLMPNWFAGLAGPIGWGTLFFLRVGREEMLMIDTFGEEYRRYMARTKRVVPGLY